MLFMGKIASTREYPVYCRYLNYFYSCLPHLSTHPQPVTNPRMCRMRFVPPDCR